MKKNFIYYSIIWLISLLIFNVVVFVSPNEAGGMTKFGGAFWTGYVFITIAFLGGLACAYKAFRSENLKKVFYNIPLISISYIGLVAMLVVGTACMAIPNLPNWLGAIICLVVLAFTAISIIKASVAEGIVEDIDEKVKAHTQFIKMLTLDSESLMTSATSAELKTEAKKVYEAIRYSDPVSDCASKDVENQIRNGFKAFSDAVRGEDLEVAKAVGAELQVLIDSRNKECKLLK